MCQFIKDQLDPTSVDSLFFAAEISQAISGCEVRTQRACVLGVGGRSGRQADGEVIATLLIKGLVTCFVSKRGFFVLFCCFFTVIFLSTVIS